MSVTADILRSWHSPRLVLRARLSQGVREDRALAVLLCACLMMFIAQWPALARAAQAAPDVPLQARLGGGAVGHDVSVATGVLRLGGPKPDCLTGLCGAGQRFCDAVCPVLEPACPEPCGFDAGALCRLGWTGAGELYFGGAGLAGICPALDGGPA